MPHHSHESPEERQIREHFEFGTPFHPTRAEDPAEKAHHDLDIPEYAPFTHRRDPLDMHYDPAY